MTHNKSYRRRGSCVKISVTEGLVLKASPEGGKGDILPWKDSILEYARALRSRYFGATREEKGKMLDEFTEVTGLHREAAIRLLHWPGLPGAGKRRGLGLSTLGETCLATLDDIELVKK